MAVLLTSGDIASVLNDIRSKRIALDQGKERLSVMIRPLVATVARDFPLYMRDDLKQELHLRFLGDVEKLVHDFHYGAIRDLVNHLWTMLKRDAINFGQSCKSVECRLVRIDDLQEELEIEAKTYYERSKILKKIRKALEDFYINRYPKQAYSDRASKFAYFFLKGKRPSLKSDNLRKFFRGNLRNARQAYTTALAIIRQILRHHKEEIRWITRKS